MKSLNTGIQSWSRWLIMAITTDETSDGGGSLSGLDYDYAGVYRQLGVQKQRLNVKKEQTNLKLQNI